MAERTMEELLQAPTEGYGEAIVIPEINADHFEIKTNLLQLVQANPFHGCEKIPILTITILKGLPRLRNIREECSNQRSMRGEMGGEAAVRRGGNWREERGREKGKSGRRRGRVGSTASSSSTQNVAFISENTSILKIRSGKHEDSKALVTLDGEGVDWISHSEDEQENYALMACSSSSSDTEEKIRFMKIDLDDKTDVLTYHKKLLAEAEKEKEDLKAKVEKWHNSSKNLNILLNSQMSAKDKAGLGTSDIEDSPVNDRYAEGMHAVPPPMTGIYIPSGPDKEIDDSQFQNMDFIEFCGSKGIKREYSNARTPQQNRVAERKNRTLIKAARTMLANSFLPNTFWAEAVSTACYVLNRVLVTKPQNKTPYELITSKIPIISYIRPFGCHVTILNTIDHLGKFEGKSDEGFLVGYSLQSKAFRVYNLETKRVEENLHITFLENNPNVAGKGPTWLFDLDYLTDSMNYQPVRSENQANKHAGPQEANQNAGSEDNIDAVKSSKANNAGEEPTEHPEFKQVDKEDQVFLDELERLKRQEQDAKDAAEALGRISTVSPYGGLSFTDPTNTDLDDSEIPALKEIYDNLTDGIFINSSYDDEGAMADFTNLEPVVNFKQEAN
ncbi:ribonuclease H-like domain-containing protein [Tanacetum coccineum]